MVGPRAHRLNADGLGSIFVLQDFLHLLPDSLLTLTEWHGPGASPLPSGYITNCVVSCCAVSRSIMSCCVACYGAPAVSIGVRDR